MKKHLKPKLILVLVLVVAVLIVSYGALSPKEQKYLSATVTSREMSTYTAYSGTVELKNDLTQTAKQQLLVKELYVKEGDIVAAGDPILMTKDGVKITAESQGTLTEWYVSTDDAVQNGGRLARIADYKSLQGTFSIDELQVNSLMPGHTLSVYAGATGQEMQGVITSIGEDPSIDGGVAYYTVYFDLNDTSLLRNGMSLEVRIVNEYEKDALVLPVYALTFDDNGKTYVYRRISSKYQLQEVSIGISDGVYAQLKSGAALGDVLYYKEAEQAVKGVFKTLLGR